MATQKPSSGTAADYARIPKTGQYYLRSNPSEVISKRSYLTLQRGGTTIEQLAQTRRAAGIPSHERGYQKLLSEFHANYNSRLPDYMQINRKKAATLFQPYYANIKEPRQLKNKAKNDERMRQWRRLNGPLDIALRVVGRRNGTEDYPVGETPKV